MKGANRIIGKVDLTCASARNLATSIHVDLETPWGPVEVGHQVAGWMGYGREIQGIASSDDACGSATYTTWAQVFDANSNTWSKWDFDRRFVSC